MRYQEVFEEFRLTVGKEKPVVKEGATELPARRVLCVCDSPEMHTCSSKLDFKLWQMDTLQDGIDVLRAGYAEQGRNAAE